MAQSTGKRCCLLVCVGGIEKGSLLDWSGLGMLGGVAGRVSTDL